MSKQYGRAPHISNHRMTNRPINHLRPATFPRTPSHPLSFAIARLDSHVRAYSNPSGPGRESCCRHWSGQLFLPSRQWTDRDNPDPKHRSVRGHAPDRQSRFCRCRRCVRHSCFCVVIEMWRFTTDCTRFTGIHRSWEALGEGPVPPIRLRSQHFYCSTWSWNSAKVCFLLPPSLAEALARVFW